MMKTGKKIAELIAELSRKSEDIWVVTPDAKRYRISPKMELDESSNLVLYATEEEQCLTVDELRWELEHLTTWNDDEYWLEEDLPLSYQMFGDNPAAHEVRFCTSGMYYDIQQVAKDILITGSVMH